MSSIEPPSSPRRALTTLTPPSLGELGGGAGAGSGEGGRELESEEGIVPGSVVVVLSCVSLLRYISARFDDATWAFCRGSAAMMEWRW